MTNISDALSPEQAEAVFYAAFENGDLEAMAGIWARSDDVVCIHPHGPQLVGYGPVVESWQSILDNAEGFRITVQLINDYSDGDVAVRFVNEILSSEDNDGSPVTVLATNAYRRTEAGWRIVLHHASPTPQTQQSTADRDPEPADTGVTLH